MCNTLGIGKDKLSSVLWKKSVFGIWEQVHVRQGSHRLEKYLNIQYCLEKSLKIKFALKST